jgi:hypothetical protein
MSYAAISYVRIRLLVCEREHATRRFHSLVWLSNGGFFMLNGTKSVEAKQGEAGPPPAILLGSLIAALYVGSTLFMLLIS